MRAVLPRKHCAFHRVAISAAQSDECVAAEKRAAAAGGRSRRAKGGNPVKPRLSALRSRPPVSAASGRHAPSRHTSAQRPGTSGGTWATGRCPCPTGGTGRWSAMDRSPTLRRGGQPGVPLGGYRDGPGGDPRLRRAGAKADTTCGIHIHVGLGQHTPASLRRLVNLSTPRRTC